MGNNICAGPSARSPSRDWRPLWGSRFLCTSPKQPQPHPSRSQVIPCHSLPRLFAFVSPLPSARMVQLLPRLEGSAPKSPVRCWPTLTPAESLIPRLSVGQTLLLQVVSFHWPQIAAGGAHARLPHWLLVPKNKDWIVLLCCLELCFAHSRGSVNIYWVNQSAPQQGPS